MREDGGDLVLIGSGGFGRETAEAVKAAVAAGSRWRLIGYIDDDPARAGTVIDGVPVIGGRKELDRLPDARVVVCTGRPDNYVSRPRIVSALGFPPERYATVVHPAASVSAVVVCRARNRLARLRGAHRGGTGGSSRCCHAARDVDARRRD